VRALLQAGDVMLSTVGPFTLLLRGDPEEAAATLYVLYSPQVAAMLMGDYGWSPERYESWLARMILQAVIRSADA